MNRRLVELSFFVLILVVMVYDFYNAEFGKGLFSVSFLYVIYLLITKYNSNNVPNIKIISYVFIIFALVGSCFDFYYGQAGRAIGGGIIVYFIYLNQKGLQVKRNREDIPKLDK